MLGCTGFIVQSHQPYRRLTHDFKRRPAHSGSSVAAYESVGQSRQTGLVKGRGRRARELEVSANYAGVGLGLLIFFSTGSVPDNLTIYNPYQFINDYIAMVMGMLVCAAAGA